MGTLTLRVRRLGYGQFIKTNETSRLSNLRQAFKAAVALPTRNDETESMRSQTLSGLPVSKACEIPTVAEFELQTIRTAISRVRHINASITQAQSQNNEVPMVGPREDCWGGLASSVLPALMQCKNGQGPSFHCAVQGRRMADPTPYSLSPGPGRILENRNPQNPKKVRCPSRPKTPGDSTAWWNRRQAKPVWGGVVTIEDLVEGWGWS